MKKLTSLLTCLLMSSALTFSVQAQWSYQGGIDGGYMQTIFAASDGSLYAGTQQSGIYRSDDNGATWNMTAVTSGLIGGFSESQNGTLYANTIEYNLISSQDGFTTFSVLEGLTHSFAAPHDVFVSADGAILATSGTEIFRSTDNGVTFNSVFNTNAWSGLLGFREGNAGKLYQAGSYAGMWMSEDNGQTWDVLPVPDNSVIGYTVTDAGSILIATNTGLYRSVDDGANWDNLDATPAASVTVLGTDRITFISNLHHILSSDDGGQSFTTVREFQLDARVVQYLNGDLWILSDSEGLYSSPDHGATLTPQSTGLTSQVVADVQCDTGGNIFALSNFQLYRKLAGENSWNKLETPLPEAPEDFTGFTVLNDGTLFAAVRGNAFTSADLGETWNEIEGNPITLSPLAVIRQSPDGNTLFAGGTLVHIYRSLDGGQNWEMLDNDINNATDFAWDGNGNIFAANPNLLNGGIYRSTDNGDTWELIRNATSNEIAVSPDGSVFYASSGGDGIVRSTDGGENWESVNDDIFPEDSQYRQGFIQTLDFDGEGRLFTTGQFNYWTAEEGNVITHGTYYSPDNGDHWVQAGDGLNHPTAITLDKGLDGYMYAGTVSGVYKFEEELEVVDSQMNLIPESVVLEQNYPNPFNPSTTIQFGIDVSGIVSLRLFNVVGQEIATILDTPLPAGHHTVEFNASELASGIYFLRLEAGGATEARRIQLVR